MEKPIYSVSIDKSYEIHALQYQVANRLTTGNINERRNWTILQSIVIPVGRTNEDH